MSCINIGDKMHKIIKKNISTTSAIYCCLQQKAEALKRAKGERNILILHSAETGKEIKTSLVPAITKKVDINDFNIEELRQLMVSFDFVVMYYEINSRERMILSEVVLQVMGKNHLFLYSKEKDDDFKEKLLFLAKCNQVLNASNHDFYVKSKLGQDIMSILHRGTYWTDLYKELLIGLGEIDYNSFKSVPCHGESKARRKRTSSELKIFLQLQKPLIHLAYNFIVVSSYIDPTIYILDRLNRAIGNIYVDIDTTWSEIREVYKPYINSRKLEAYLKSNKEMIENNEELLGDLFYICKKGIEKFKRNRAREIQCFSDNLKNLNYVSNKEIGMSPTLLPPIQFTN